MDKTFDFARRRAPYFSPVGGGRAPFARGAPSAPNAEPFSIVIPPPNVTGNLHMGHALNNTLQDILARYWRMKGRDVLWQPGTDHAGIATQMVVERQLAAQGRGSARDGARRRFSAKVWAWKAESGGAIVGQLKRLGASCDWSARTVHARRGPQSKAVAKVFVQLHREGLIYRDKRLVNWDPKFQTAISDLEVVQVEAKGSFKWSRDGRRAVRRGERSPRFWRRTPSGHFYHFEYRDRRRCGRGDRRGRDGRHDAARRRCWATPPSPCTPTIERYTPRWVGAQAAPAAGRAADPCWWRTNIPIPEKGTGAVKITPGARFQRFRGRPAPRGRRRARRSTFSTPRRASR